MNIKLITEHRVGYFFDSICQRNLWSTVYIFFLGIIFTFGFAFGRQHFSSGYNVTLYSLIALKSTQIRTLLCK